MKKLSDRREIQAALVINNYGAYVEATQNSLGHCVVYRINCFRRPLCYIGISIKIEQRIAEHLRGKSTNWAQDFVARHGVGTVDVLAICQNREEAQRLEWQYWQRMRARLGADNVGGFSPAAEFGWQGHA